MYERFLRELEETDLDRDRTWDWIKKVRLKGRNGSADFCCSGAGSEDQSCEVSR